MTAKQAADQVYSVLIRHRDIWGGPLTLKKQLRRISSMDNDGWTIEAHHETGNAVFTFNEGYTTSELHSIVVSGWNTVLLPHGPYHLNELLTRLKDLGNSRIGHSKDDVTELPTDDGF